MKSRILAAAAAIILAVVGAVLVFSYAQGADMRAMQRLEPVQVLVADEAVPVGTSVEALRESLQMTSLPAAAVPPSALRDLAEVDGLVTAAELVPGEALVRERFVAAEELQTPGSVPVPDGMQEVSFTLEPQRVVGGRISAGDTVGIFVSFDDGAIAAAPTEPSTQRIFHKVLVTSIQRADAAAEGDTGTALPSGAMLVTVALTDADASKLVFSSEFGRVWLTKEPAEATEDVGGPVRKLEVYP